MRGNKFKGKILLFVAILCLGVVASFSIISKPIKSVEAEEPDYSKTYCSQQYDDNVIFSAEHVYYADNKTTASYYINNTDNKYKFTQMKDTDNNDVYFGNYNLAQGDSSKKLIKRGADVMLDDTVSGSKTGYDSDGAPVALKQGIMVTLGGYIYDDTNKVVKTNAEQYTEGGKDYYYSAGLIYVDVTVYKDGEKLKELKPRTYNDGINFDWVYFIDANTSADGHYVFDIKYMVETGNSAGTIQSHTFDFYVLIKSIYTKTSEINGYNYSANPTLSNATKNSDTSVYEAKINDTQQPVISYDYKLYNFNYTYFVNDLLTTVEVEYKTSPDKLVVTRTTNKVSTIKEYSCKFLDNNIVNFVFSDIGEYTFNFKYVHYEKDIETKELFRREIDDLEVASIKLNIYGYEMKYAKTGYYSSNFRKLYLVENGTLVIPENGYLNQDATETDRTTSLGYMYEIVTPDSEIAKTLTDKRSGVIASRETTDVTDKVGTDASSKITLSEDLSGDPKTLTFSKLETDIINTDQRGAWLNLNDNYSLTNSYYIHSDVAFKIKTGYNITALKKETTFSDTGYYFVKACYTIGENTTDVETQYFIFKLTSPIANIQLYTIGAEDTIPDPLTDLNRLYSDQFTNKNVLATWTEPTTFESEQKVSLYKAQAVVNCYQSKSRLVYFADGGADATLVKEGYTKESRITTKGSYLLEMAIVGTQVKSRYYFTIDTDPISNVKILETSMAYLGSTPIYLVHKDADGNAISYDGELFINQAFTINWDDKLSGASINAKYRYTKIEAKTSTLSDKNNGTDTYVYADYTFGSTSGFITIEKPSSLSSVLDSNYVLTKSGIYWFEIEDAAGNKATYMIIFDDTKAKFSATDKNGNSVSHGDTSNTDVTIEWGTHKALALGAGVEGDIRDILLKLKGGDAEEETVKNYYSLTGSNFSCIESSVWGDLKDELTLLVKHKKAIVKAGTKWEKEIEINSTKFEYDSLVVNNGHNITLKLTEDAVTYVVHLYGENQSHDNDDSVSYFKIILNPDKSQGTIISSDDENGFDSENTRNNVRIHNKLETYSEAQATDDTYFVFEWKSEAGSDHEVKTVYYEYFPLMSQTALNKYKANSNSDEFKYYPYEYHDSEDENMWTYIYGGDNDANLYDIIETRGDELSYRSHILNSGYVLKYDDNGNLVASTATLPGMYIITRIYADDVQVAEKDSTTKQYIFFVDRNKIIDYSVTDFSQKTIGEYIEWYLQEINFSNYTQDITIEKFTIDNEETSVKIYLESNRLPLNVLVPTGKYASMLEKAIQRTSNSSSGGLKMEIYYKDDYNILGNNKDGDVLNIKLFEMKNMQKLGEAYDTEHYISYLLKSGSFISNEWVTKYLSACGKSGESYFSLPGSYAIRIYDNVGKVLEDDSTWEVVSPNVTTLGIKITLEKPSFDVYINQNPDDNTNVEVKTFEEEITTFKTEDKTTPSVSTSKAYVRYLLPKADNTSFYAQIDESKIIVLQDDKTYAIDAQKTFEFNGKNINYIQKTPDGTYIWLDTGLEIVNGQIVDYKEYEYTITVRYELGKDDIYQNYYVYNGKKFYEITAKVKIDRTAYIENLKNIIAGDDANGYLSQKEYLESYFNSYSDDDFEVKGKLKETIYNTIGYRGIDGSDNYAVINQLYYYYVDKGDLENAKNAMYAIRVNENTKYTTVTETEKNNSIYYRKLYGGANKTNYMSLLPICATYYGDSSNFETYPSSEFVSKEGLSDNTTWSNILDDDGYYEIIEKDEAGNLTQYVVLYIKDNSEATSYNPSFKFTDLTTYPFEVSFNFAEYADVENKKELKFDGKISVIYNETERDAVALTGLQDVEDSFKVTTLDKYFKVTIKTNKLETIIYLNYNNYLSGTKSKIASDIKENLESFKEGNLYLTIENRFGEKLVLDVLKSENLDQYSLNLSKFKASYDTTKGTWYADPDELTSKISFENGETVDYYATTIKLTKMSDNTSETYSRGTGWTEIGLTENEAYYAEITDLGGKSYTKILYAYDNEADDSIKVYGAYETISDVYYSSNIVDITSNAKIYTDQKIKISLNGSLIYNSTINLDKEKTMASINVLSIKYAKISYDINLNQYLTRFYPYSYNYSSANTSGGLLDIEIELIYSGNMLNKYHFIIDNRIGSLQFVADELDQSKNLVISYKSILEDEKGTVSDKNVNYTMTDLFQLAPMSTLSDEAYLNWEDILDLNYVSNETYRYFRAKVRLYEFISKDNWVEIDISKNNYVYIPPKVDVLGRYVFVVEVTLANANKMTVYKAYSFNVSTTANAMYKVQDPEGNKMEYADSITGSDLMQDGLFVYENIANVFGFTSIDDPNYTTFEAQKIPVYVSNKVLTVVRNGENDLAYVELKLDSAYTLYLYKVYNKVYTTYLVIMQVKEVDELISKSTDIMYGETNLAGENNLFVDTFGTLKFPLYYQGQITSDNQKKVVKINKLYLEVYYVTSGESYMTKVGDFYGTREEGVDYAYVTFKTSGRYYIYLRDVAGNTRTWGRTIADEPIKYLTLTIIPEVILTTNDEVPVNYAYYNNSVTVAVAFKNYSNFYDNASVRMYAFRNGSDENYITTVGGRKTEFVSEFTFSQYGTYRVVVKALRNGSEISKEIVFSIINPNEARLALDFTAISKYNIESVSNITLESDVTDIFSFLINEGYIYSKLITFERLSAENAFGVNMGKQTFEVAYSVNDDEMVPKRMINFKFTINNETPTIQSSLKAGKTTTKKVKLKFNPQVIYRQAGDCYVMVNDEIIMAINEESAIDETKLLTLSSPAVYYVKIVTDSGRVLSSFKVRIKEPMNTWSIILIVGIVLLVVGVIVTFIILRTKMKVR